ncbi:hypothetical protein SH580_16460 [Coraliomargarita algicola]|uniref:BPL/LPL catalytic domain-containing protein n=1 Tax=Coraliomargarita algicola TaxID=3092156 RepID=A0ABZ0RHN1_9BACT|nr:hypothetical protein [Coraliomargarita sp. J2-16]WPJ95022.1 hypothetical protein SH580_16460 [Coraliomargarita sp. J2-16]
MLIALPNAFGDASTNMAIDAALLESIPNGLAALRHYAWLEPAASFGYSQRYTEVVQATAPNIQLVRRLTGGGIVDHRNDWTYALIIQRALPCAAIAASELYLKVHHAIQLALKEMDIESRLAPCPRNCKSTDPVSQCFVTPAANDVLRPDGQKIAGAAMKRTRQGLLIQGSLDRSTLPDAFNFAHFQTRLQTQLAQTLQLPLGELEDIRPLFNSERIEREKQRFADRAWNQKR